ncbi:hypothetical protein PAXRUDRAFT_439903 [Paxillus rubicundulus Ve08.2h10]|uniref:Uncharacterized protein n=1 Tax=Paxillus rubicundulus Ve08.2h10 TaxID=930991 RepID=A0A0D0E844_9AGAM|nr:hypothetical protein PAXRUDRAFT_439903 [Paxillus rubicundulus Ve08.2h10]
MPAHEIAFSAHYNKIRVVATSPKPYNGPESNLGKSYNDVITQIIGSRDKRCSNLLRHYPWRCKYRLPSYYTINQLDQQVIKNIMHESVRNKFNDEENTRKEGT